MNRKTWVTVCALTFVAVLPASAGVVAEIEHRDLTADPPKIRTLVMSVSGQNLRMAIPPDGAMVYRGADETMLLIDDANKSYISLTRQELESLTAQLGSMMKQLEAQLAALPPEQRKMAEQMMQAGMPRGDAEALPPMTFKKSSESAEIDGHACTKVEVWRGDRRSQELWITPLEGLEGAAEASAAMRGLGSFFETLLSALRDSPMAAALPFQDNPFVELEKLGGFPVRRLEYAGDRLVGESNLKSTARRDLPADRFQAPAGYSRQQLPTISSR